MEQENFAECTFDASECQTYILDRNWADVTLTQTQHILINTHTPIQTLTHLLFHTPYDPFRSIPIYSIDESIPSNFRPHIFFRAVASLASIPWSFLLVHLSLCNLPYSNSFGFCCYCFFPFSLSSRNKFPNEQTKKFQFLTKSIQLQIERVIFESESERTKEINKKRERK